MGEDEQGGTGMGRYDGLIDGIVAMLEEDIRQGIAKSLDAGGVAPSLGMVVRPASAGGAPADMSFCRSIARQAARLGIDIVCEECGSEDDAAASVAGMVADGHVSGIVVLSDYGDETDRMLAGGIPVRLDVDAKGAARADGGIPCVAQAAVGLLAEAFAKRYEEDRFRAWVPGDAWHGRYENPRRDPLSGMNVLVLGRSEGVGMPIAIELIRRGASVGVLNSASIGGPWRQERGTHVLPTDQLLWDGVASCVGRAHEWDDVNLTRVRPQTVLVDVGTSVIEDADGKTRLVGDFSPLLDGHVGYRSPVPGGIGKLTTLELLRRVACGSGRR